MEHFGDVWGTRNRRGNLTLVCVRWLVGALISAEVVSLKVAASKNPWTMAGESLHVMWRKQARVDSEVKP